MDTIYRVTRPRNSRQLANNGSVRAYMKTKAKEGRPTKFTQETLSKLEEAFLMGCSDKEACLIAGITQQTLIEWKKDKPEFTERIELLRQNPIALARQSVIKHMARDGKLALGLLERVKKDEFSLRHEISGNNGNPIEIRILEE